MKDQVDQTQDFHNAIKRRSRRAVRAFRAVAAGFVPRSCPICGYHGMFTPFGHPPRIDAQCAKCSSLERHRMLKLLLDRSGIIAADHSVLHFAPEWHVRGFLRDLCGRYVTADLMRDGMDLRLDIEAMDLPDDAFDRIVCFQVLEHVDDAKGLAEMFRVLAPGGVALLNTPVIEGWDRTYENDAIDGKRERLLHFGQGDHVRYYGRDIRDRISAAGFDCEEFCAEEPDVRIFGLWRGERIFLARKPGGSAAKTA